MSGPLHYAEGTPVPRPPAAPEAHWAKLHQTWTGWDGSQWVLTDPESGLFLIDGGVRGLGMPVHSSYSSESPALHGSRHLGSRVLPRDCFWPLHIYSEGGSDEWRALQDAFWRTMHRNRPGIWRVEANGSARELTVVYEDSDEDMERDPHFHGWQTFGVRMLAHDPFWRAEWVVREFENTTTTGSFFGTGAPSFFISSSSQLATSTIANPGNEPSYLTYLLHGPFTSATVGIGDPGPNTTFSQQVAQGYSVVLDTRPATPATARRIPTPAAKAGTPAWEAQVFGVEGENVFGGVTALALNSPLQPGQERPLSLSMSGPGRVTVAHRPPYWRGM